MPLRESRNCAWSIATAVLGWTIVGLPALADGQTTVKAVPEAYSSKDDLFVGPILGQLAGAFPVGQFGLQPFLIVSDHALGAYGNDGRIEDVPKSTSVELYNQFYYGITSWLSAEFVLPVFLDTDSDQNRLDTGDTIFQVNLDVHDQPGPNAVWPALDFAVLQTFPTGPYDRLAATSRLPPNGAGAWRTGGQVQVEWQLTTPHTSIFDLRLYAAPDASASIHGLSAYGGDPETRGHEHIGPQVNLTASGQYAISHHFDLSIDVQYVANGNLRFSGDPGQGQTAAGLALPLSNLLSMAPGVEWVIRPGFGFNFGVWFSIAGRNATAFIAPTAAIALLL